MTADAPHPIALEQVIFTRVTVAAIPGHAYQEDAPVASPENSLDVRKLDGEEGTYQAVMATLVNPDRDTGSPYYIDIECVAILRADATLTDEEAKRGVTITAHSVLFGAIRETVAWLTGRQPYGPLMLGLSVLRPKQSVTQA